MSDTVKRIAGFYPIGEGVTAHYVNAVGDWWTRPVMGWLSVDEYESDHSGDALIDPSRRPYRRVVPGVLEESEVRIAEDLADFWFITLSDDDGPTPADVASRAEEIRGEGWSG